MENLRTALAATMFLMGIFGMAFTLVFGAYAAFQLSHWWILAMPVGIFVSFYVMSVAVDL